MYANYTQEYSIQYKYLFTGFKNKFLRLRNRLGLIDFGNHDRLLDYFCLLERERSNGAGELQSSISNGTGINGCNLAL